MLSKKVVQNFKEKEILEWLKEKDNRQRLFELEQILSLIHIFMGRDFVCSRILQNGHVSIPNRDTVFHLGDQLFVVCAEDDAVSYTHLDVYKRQGRFIINGF